MEEWKQVPSIPKLEVSSLGRIRSTPHEEKMPNGGYRLYGGTATFGQWGGKRYIYNFGGKDKNHKVARLVCEAFNGPPPFPYAVCMHHDENARNNVPSNLKWGTQEQNLNYPGFIEYCQSRIGNKSPMIKHLIKKGKPN